MSYNKTKTDPVLGQQVHEHLVSVGVETPVTDNGLSRTEKIDKIENNFNQIMDTLGLDLNDDSLIDTPKRVAKMYVNEIFWGLDYEAFPKATVVDNKMNYNEMVCEKNISVQSNCEHHFVVIDGLYTGINLSIFLIPLISFFNTIFQRNFWFPSKRLDFTNI